MKLLSIKSNYWILLYYILLFGVFVSWTDFNSVPGAVLRIAYYAALLVPIFLLKQTQIFSLVMSFFITISQYGYSSSYMPAENLTFFIPAVVLLFFFKKHSYKKSVPLVISLLLALSTFVNFVDSGSFTFIFFTLVLIVTFTKYTELNEHNTDLFFLMFIVISLYLSVLQMTVGQLYSVVEMMGNVVVDRSGFQDINYGACVVSLGVTLAIAYLVIFSNKTFVPSLISIVTIIVALIALFSNASRGSVLSIALPAFVVVAFSKIDFKYKLLTGVVITGLTLYLLNSGYAEYFLYRIESDNGTGAGRTVIWATKFEAFFSQSNFLQLFFGWGYDSGRNLAISNLVTGFHNDFLAFLVEYGIIGLFLFIAFFFKPITNVWKNKNEIPVKNKIIVYAMMSCLFVISMTLEPFAAGRLPYYSFWFLAYLISKSKDTVII